MNPDNAHSSENQQDSHAVVLAQRLGIGPEQRARLGRLGARLRSVGEFLSGAIEPIAKLGKSELVEAATRGSGWAGLVARSIKEAAPWAELAGTVVPPLKLLTMIIDHATKQPDPEVLAYLAWSTAYQRSVLQAVTLLADRAVGKGDVADLGARVRSAVEQFAIPEEPTIVGPTLEGALAQPFVRHADELLDAYASAAGFGDTDRRLLLQQVHERFRWNLDLLLSHGDFRERFAPLLTLLELGGGEQLVARDILRRHADYQRSLFEEARVLQHEPFSLANVYIPNDCGVLTWGECSEERLRHGDGVQRSRPDPFDEKVGGRHSLLYEVLRRMRDPSFRDVLIVQGVAGSGKSTFSLSLCAHLVREGLTPIRVRLRDIDVHQHAKHAIPAQVLYEDDEGHERRPRDPEALFRDLALFDELEVSFGEARISPYVLVLDGWDELETSGDQRVRERIPRFIEEVRRSFVTGPRNIVRVVLTGRPWSTVTRSDAGFLGAETPILTIRSWNPEQLGRFFTKVTHLVDVAPLGWPEGTPAWSVVGSETLAKAKEVYARSWARAQGEERSETDAGATLEILGSPLLAHLTVRLLSRQGVDVDALLLDTTQLYRRLVDLTCIDGGRAPEVAGEVRRALAFTGANLRTLLHVTAMAMTIEDRERISYEVLEQRIRDLDALHPFEEQELARLVRDASEAFPVAELLIAFFFKGGRRDLGCEFAHKSFREYLFAEALVEVLKSVAEFLPPRARRRSRWWSDFSDGDPRRDLVRRLGPALAAQWMTSDVVQHLGSLLCWEIGRSVEPAADSEQGIVLPPISTEGWIRIRDALADVWEWWAEGVHLRSMVRLGRRGDLEEEQPLAVEQARWIYPADWRTQAGQSQARLPAPMRTVTVDAHLGDALLRLCGWIHEFVARSQGMQDGGAEWVIFDSEIEYQSMRKQGGVEWVRFRPGGSHYSYFNNFIGRINGSGWRPRGSFPSGVGLVGADFRSAFLLGADFSDADLSGADLSNVNLSGAYLRGTVFAGAILSHADLKGADLTFADLRGADLAQANLRGVDLTRANLSGANLQGADLSGSNLSGAELSGANLKDADLLGVDIRVAAGLTVTQLLAAKRADGAIVD